MSEETKMPDSVGMGGGDPKLTQYERYMLLIQVNMLQLARLRTLFIAGGTGQAGVEMAGERIDSADALLSNIKAYLDLDLDRGRDRGPTA